MNIEKKLLLIIVCLAVVQNMDAGWPDQWARIRNYFSEFRIKKPSLTNKQTFFGVSALAIATGAAWWWYNRPSRPSINQSSAQDQLGSFQEQNKEIKNEIASVDRKISDLHEQDLTAQKNEQGELQQSVVSGQIKNEQPKKQSNVNVHLQKKQKMPHQSVQPIAMKDEHPEENILQPKEQIEFKLWDVVKIVQGPSNRFAVVIDHLGVVTQVFDQDKCLTVDIVPDALNTIPTRRFTIKKEPRDFFKKVAVEQGQNGKISLNQEVVINLKNGQGAMVPCIGRVVKQNNNEITVKAGSKNRNIVLQERTCIASDVWVEKKV